MGLRLVWCASEVTPGPNRDLTPAAERAVLLLTHGRRVQLRQRKERCKRLPEEEEAQNQELSL